MILYFYNFSRYVGIKDILIKNEMYIFWSFIYLEKNSLDNTMIFIYEIITKDNPLFIYLEKYKSVNITIFLDNA